MIKTPLADLLTRDVGAYLVLLLIVVTGMTTTGPPSGRPNQRDLQSARYLIFKGVSGLVIGVIYASVLTDGLKALVPALSQRVLFGVSIAMLLALVMYAVVTLSWELALFALLGVDAAFTRWGFSLKSAKAVVLTIAGVLLFADAAIFYCSVSKMGWHGLSFKFSALVATLAYLACIVFCSFVGCILKKPLLDDPQ